MELSRHGEMSGGRAAVVRDQRVGSFKRQRLIRVFVTLLLGWGIPQLASAETHEINMKDRRFSTETMRIKVGETVKWVNGDKEPHQVMSGTDLEDPHVGTPLSADLIEPGQDYTFTFNKPGRYPYMCFIHWARATIKGKVAMSGEIIVEP
jgi:plastocyanin